jgi:hypothetical protein
MSTDLAVSEIVDVESHVPANLFGTTDPVAVVEQSSKIASALSDVLKQKGLAKKISGREFVLVEGWTLLGTMLGVFPVVEWTRKLEDGWEARVEARTLGGQVVGAAEAECLRSEKSWAKRDDYALRSMAQTRAMSKALRGPLGFIVQLAGFSPTPAEEMPDESLASGPGTQTHGSDTSGSDASDPERKAAIAALDDAFKHATDHGSLPPGQADWASYLRDEIAARYGVTPEQWRTRLTPEQMLELAGWLAEQEIPL